MKEFSIKFVHEILNKEQRVGKMKNHLCKAFIPVLLIFAAMTAEKTDNIMNEIEKFSLVSSEPEPNPSLWAIGVGPNWGNTGSCVIDPDTFSITEAAYPDDDLFTLVDATYSSSCSTLFISGMRGGGSPNWWTQNTIMAYAGTPDKLHFESASNAGMNGYYWLAGIEYVDGHLYAIGITNITNGRNMLIRIDNPATPSQTATQIGSYLGYSDVMGLPFALCTDGANGLYAAFEENLYHIDIASGAPTFLHTYTSIFEGLTFMEGILYGINTNGEVYRIDTTNYSATFLGDLEGSPWTALVTFSIMEPGRLHYVNGTVGNDLYDGLAPFWEGTHGPKKTIQAAINTSVSGDAVFVAEGTYTGYGNRDISFYGRNITLQSELGAEHTIIDCQGTEAEPHRGFLLHCGESPDAIVDGFTIINGYGYSNRDIDDEGGGIACFESSPTIKNCIINACECQGYDGYGGAISSVTSSPTIINCALTENNCHSHGGGVNASRGSIVTLIDCEVNGNDAGHQGGGIFCDGSSSIIISNSIVASNRSHYGNGICCLGSLTLTNSNTFDNQPIWIDGGQGGGIYCGGTAIIKNSAITGNSAGISAGNEGGGMYFYNCIASIFNCLIASNSVHSFGGGIRSEDSDMEVINCTFSGNSAAIGGGIWSDTIFLLINCIVWGNSASDDWPEIYGYAATLNYCDIQGGWLGPGTNNINQNPLFVSGPDGNYYLSQRSSGQILDSPCVNSGSDLARNLDMYKYSTRVDGGADAAIVDMGFHYRYTLRIYSIIRNGDDITIQWEARNGESYIVQWTTDMDTWNNIPVGQTNQWTDVGVGETNKNYRILKF